MEIIRTLKACILNYFYKFAKLKNVRNEKHSTF